ncbi:unknown [Clostridium sp. CAG:349]|nr:unknown [Clostridium sp. CAG:349]
MFKAEFSGKKIDDVEKELAKQGIIDVEIVKNDSKRDDGYDSELVIRADVTENKAVLVTSKFRLSVPLSEE